MLVDALDAGESVTARYRVTGDEAFLAGHFPGNPVFPGVIQLEALAQTGGDPRCSPTRAVTPASCRCSVASRGCGGAASCTPATNW